MGTPLEIVKELYCFLIGRGVLAREFEIKDLSPNFKVGGTDMPDSDEYHRLLDNEFADWQLVVDGKVRTPLKLSPTAARGMERDRLVDRRAARVRARRGRPAPRTRATSYSIAPTSTNRPPTATANIT
jgi:hypothetical protein